jgi:hypothetical protein
MVPQRIDYSPCMASHRAYKLPPVSHYNFLYKSCGRDTTSLSYARSQRQLISYFHVHTVQPFIVLHECYPEGQAHVSLPTLGTFVCFVVLLVIVLSIVSAKESNATFSHRVLHSRISISSFFLKQPLARQRRDVLVIFRTQLTYGTVINEYAYIAVLLENTYCFQLISGSFQQIQPKMNLE